VAAPNQAGGERTMIGVICAQRDRLKACVSQLEEQLSQVRAGKLGQRALTMSQGPRRRERMRFDSCRMLLLYSRIGTAVAHCKGTVFGWRTSVLWSVCWDSKLTWLAKLQVGCCAGKWGG
jgi:hypothetical protein